MTLAAEAIQTSVELFLGGKVTLVQPRSGHRAGLDAALLQALLPADAAGHAVELGSGTGAVSFCIATRAPGLRVSGVEISAELVACAREALRHPGNAGFAARVRLVETDVTSRRTTREAAGLAEGSADWVAMNPPFDVEGSVRPSPDPARRFAHVAGPEALAEWCRSAAGLLRPGGQLAVIHRAAALPALLGALEDRFGDCRIKPVHPSRDAPASRVLVLARRGSRAGMRLMPGLVLHENGGSWAAEADAILRGERQVIL